MTDKQAGNESTEATTGAVEGFVAASQEDGITRVVGAAADDQGNAVIEGVVADDEGIIAEGAIGVSGDNAIVVARFADEGAAKRAYELIVSAEKAGDLD
ncbi:MAG TPA: hypothetical protein VGM28_04375, partial [Candidatus Limnocylindrales bacterium]